MKQEPAAEWTAAMDAIIQRRKARRATLGEHLINWVCFAVIAASIVTFVIAVFSGASQ